MEDARVDCAGAGRMDHTYSFLAGIDLMRPPSSIVIPAEDLDAMATVERQYWEIKAKYFDALIFFKSGKFYELYGHDATIAHREFGLRLAPESNNRRKMRLAGVPEQSFSEWARLFVFRGYKVGRVEQMKEEAETPTAKTARAKVLQRELVEVLTPGTLTDPAMVSGAGSVFILALCPLPKGGVDGLAVDLSRHAVYHCPCAAGWNGALREEEVLLMLCALLQQLRPREIIFPRHFFTNANQPDRGTVFARRLVDWIEDEGFRVELVEVALPASSHEKSDGEDVYLDAHMFLAYYFRTLRLFHAEPILSEAKPYTLHLPYASPDANIVRGPAAGSPASSSILWHERREDRGLVLDATTVSNLELVSSLRDGGERGSLNQLLNRCCTNGGKRLMRAWILRPSASSRVIVARQEAVRYIVAHKLDQFWGEGEGEGGEPEPTPPRAAAALPTVAAGGACEREPRCGVKRERLVGGAFERRFAGLVEVDFERNLSRLAELKSNHDSQVAFVDPLVQYKKQFQLILATVQAFEDMVEWSRGIQKGRSEPPALLKELWAQIDAAVPAVNSIGSCFDRQAALASGVIAPSRGKSPAYDAASDSLDAIEAKLQEELRRLKEGVFAGAGINYCAIGNDRFLVEVPLRAAPKTPLSGFLERSRSGKSVKYAVASLGPLVEEHKKAKADKSNALLLVLRNVASHMCNHFPLLYGATEALAYFDCLLSLASLQNCGITSAWPIVEDDSAGARVDAEQLTHPFLSRDSVPNSVHLSAAQGRILLLTGPNMAGKSTLMRTVAVNVIIAQMGGPIFGTLMRLATVSRIFTRIGARDASHKGQSTLYVELSETADILRHADPWSLCLVDELGRGTSTHDGYAIAHATLSSLKRRLPVSPLLLFSTHYHALAQEQVGGNQANASSSPRHQGSTVQLGYMDFSLSDGRKDGVSAITFLYRLVSGICTRSYGVEVALLAGISSSLVGTAALKSHELASWNDRQKDIRTIRQFLEATNAAPVLKKEEEKS
ncbi:mismatch repair protein [Trypanosoma conorhini]|uniref:Mismatch repair protein n=1 Tax=Trypanosoma conorhini TaxID=83891 RepID=A0A3R7MMK3_9TRYP|nr:mismatch repair protein [Trypanosoma conorhini]RNF05239.1 mismatch repair protein [Trypanosoma conorhini]